ncbi:MAG: hypothetical protein ACQEQ0_11195 [Bacteroidota bacterium]
MFLIGISGSLLPYLLVGGIVLVFSFKASERLVDNAEKENQVLASGHILFSNDSSAPVPQSSFYFSPCGAESVWADCVHDQNKEKQSGGLPGGPPLFVFESLMNACLGEPVNNSRTSGFLFSGLSPPVSVIC